MSNQEPESNPPKSKPIGKLVLFGLFIVIVASCYFFFRDKLNLEYLASIESSLQDLKSNYHLAVVVAAVLIYVIVASFPLPFATVLSLTFAWYFGFWEALLIVSFASTAGATNAFLMSRYFFRDWIRSKFNKRAQIVSDAFDRDGAFYLFSMRLIATFPFFVVNTLMGLTRIKTGTYWWVSQLGMLPGTAVYTFLGSQFPSLKNLQEDGLQLNPWLLVAFALIGLFPLVARFSLRILKKQG